MNEIISIIAGSVTGLIYFLFVAWFDYSVLKEECCEIGVKFKWYKSFDMWCYIFLMLVTGSVGGEIYNWVVKIWKIYMCS